MPFDLILRGGRVVDPSQKLDAAAPAPAISPVFASM